MNPGVQYSFHVGTSDWAFSGSSPCPGGVSDCYTVHSVSVSVDNGASVSSSWTWGGSGNPVLTVTQTVSNRLGPVSVSYTVVVRRWQEQTLTRQVNYLDENNDEQCCISEDYQDRVYVGETPMSASASLLLLPTGVSVLTQPSSAYTAATTTSVSVTLQLAPAVPVTNGHPFTAEMTSASESGTASFGMPL